MQGLDPVNYIHKYVLNIQSSNVCASNEENTNYTNLLSYRDWILVSMFKHKWIPLMDVQEIESMPSIQTYSHSGDWILVSTYLYIHPFLWEYAIHTIILSYWDWILVSIFKHTYIHSSDGGARTGEYTIYTNIFSYRDYINPVQYIHTCKIKTLHVQLKKISKL